MGLFFGSDGLRGKVNEDLTFDIAYKIGNALSFLKDKAKIIIGSDTRVSNTYLTLAVSSGAVSGGAEVIDVGVVPTAGIAYLTKIVKADFGVSISASHNSGEYNGIKIFNANGYKLNEMEEEKIERCFIHDKTNDFPNIGTYTQDFTLIKEYAHFLIAKSDNLLSGKTIVLDCAHGAAHRIAPDVFRKLGANVVAANAVNDGLKINKNCGTLYPENLVRRVFRYKADMGFAFDGDADRVIAVDENGNVIDGDRLLCGIARYLKENGALKDDTVVGTRHTNLAIEAELRKYGINVIRTDIGDKYVLAKLLEKNLSLGGEQSGHIIFNDISTTCDGILAAIIVANIAINENKKLSEIFDAKLYPQSNKNVTVKDKFRILNSEELLKETIKYNGILYGKGRLMVRAANTEPKIRIMVESTEKDLSDQIAESLSSLINKIDNEV